MFPELTDQRQDFQHRIAALYQERREEAMLKGEARRAKALREHPELRAADLKLREAGSRHLEAVLQGGERAFIAAQELRQAKEERSEILKSLGLERGFDQPDYSCPYCEDTGLADGKTCRCYVATAYPLLFAESGLKSLADHRFECFRTELFSDKPSQTAKGKIPAPREMQNQLRQTMLEYCEQFGEGEAEHYFFLGPPGTGKTYMAACVGHEILERGHSVLYLTAGELFMNLQQYRILSASYNPDPVRYEQAERLYQQIHDTELLILDDLGSEVGDTGTRLSELLTLLNSRLSQKKACLITTNLDMKQVRQVYDERLLSRLLGHFQIIRFYGDDVRLKRA